MSGTPGRIRPASAVCDVRNDDIIEELLAHERVILAREHPALENALVRAASAGRWSGPCRASSPTRATRPTC